LSCWAVFFFFCVFFCRRSRERSKNCISYIFEEFSKDSLDWREASVTSRAAGFQKSAGGGPSACRWSCPQAFGRSCMSFCFYKLSGWVDWELWGWGLKSLSLSLSLMFNWHTARQTASHTAHMWNGVFDCSSVWWQFMISQSKRVGLSLCLHSKLPFTTVTWLLFQHHLSSRLWMYLLPCKQSSNHFRFMAPFHTFPLSFPHADKAFLMSLSVLVEKGLLSIVCCQFSFGTQNSAHL
jgi:hypothetical protein